MAPCCFVIAGHHFPGQPGQGGPRASSPFFVHTDNFLEIYFILLGIWRKMCFLPSVFLLSHQISLSPEISCSLQKTLAWPWKVLESTTMRRPLEGPSLCFPKVAPPSVSVFCVCQQFIKPNITAQESNVFARRLIVCLSCMALLGAVGMRWWVRPFDSHLLTFNRVTQG